MKLYQQNSPGMNLPCEEHVLHSAPKVTPTNAIAAFCAECSASPAACTKAMESPTRQEQSKKVKI